MVTAGAAVWVQQYQGDGTLNNTIKIRYNRFHNLDGRISDGRGGYLTSQTSQWSTGIHPSDISSVPGIEIAWNQIINEPYQSGVGDSINIFDTSGTSGSPVQVHDNLENAILTANCALTRHVRVAVFCRGWPKSAVVAALAPSDVLKLP
jgi:hypothetical protein